MLKHIINFLFVVPAREETAKIICSETKCALCGKCRDICAKNAIAVDNTSRLYYSYRCNRCGQCIGVCPNGALAFAEK